jgi:GNAT superfamily N-acetyltransferase
VSALATVTLLPVALESAHSSSSGGVLVPGPTPWHPEYPLLETIQGLSMLIGAHQAVGWDALEVPAWWMYQIVVAEDSGRPQVVGDVGFHGPPAADDLVVEVGYDVVPAMRGRGIATAACTALVNLAWRDGARAVRAEAEVSNEASRRVLAGVGFAEQPDGSFLIELPS